MTQNQIAYQAHLEQMRANRAKEAENVRSNQARENENQRSNLARESETRRSNLATERENKRSNKVRERETNRSNLANELLKGRAQDLSEKREKWEKGTTIAKTVTGGLKDVGSTFKDVTGGIKDIVGIKSGISKLKQAADDLLKKKDNSSNQASDGLTSGIGKVISSAKTAVEEAVGKIKNKFKRRS